MSEEHSTIEGMHGTNRRRWNKGQTKQELGANIITPSKNTRGYWKHETKVRQRRATGNMKLLTPEEEVDMKEKSRKVLLS